MKTQTNGKMFLEDLAWVTVLERKVEKSRKKCFFKKNNFEKESMFFLRFLEEAQNRRLVKENQGEK